MMREGSSLNSRACGGASSSAGRVTLRAETERDAGLGQTDSEAAVADVVRAAAAACDVASSSIACCRAASASRSMPTEAPVDRARLLDEPLGAAEHAARWASEVRDDVALADEPKPEPMLRVFELTDDRDRGCWQYRLAVRLVVEADVAGDHRSA